MQEFFSSQFNSSFSSFFFDLKNISWSEQSFEIAQPVIKKTQISYKILVHVFDDEAAFGEFFHSFTDTNAMKLLCFTSASLLQVSKLSHALF